MRAAFAGLKPSAGHEIPRSAPMFSEVAAEHGRSGQMRVSLERGLSVAEVERVLEGVRRSHPVVRTAVTWDSHLGFLFVDWTIEVAAPAVESVGKKRRWDAVVSTVGRIAAFATGSAAKRARPSPAPCSAKDYAGLDLPPSTIAILHHIGSELASAGGVNSAADSTVHFERNLSPRVVGLSMRGIGRVKHEELADLLAVWRALSVDVGDLHTKVVSIEFVIYTAVQDSEEEAPDAVRVRVGIE